MSFPSMMSRRAPRVLSAVTNATLRNTRLVHSVPNHFTHSVPSLISNEKFIKNGIPGVFTPSAFDTAWTKYQGHLVQNLNRLIDGTDYQNMSVIDIAIASARQADLAATFNYASQAHNNHFFFTSLGNEKTSVPESLNGLIPYSFANMDALRTEMLTIAAKMFGNGWVWLVLDQRKYLRILCTYNAGTPYGAAYRRQDTDMNTTQKLGIAEMTAATREATRGPATNWALPLLNINVWQHAYIQDYGVDGKERYLEDVWEAIDWNVVASRVNIGGNAAPIQRTMM